MKKFIVLSSLLFIVSISFSQTGTVINDLSNFYTLRAGFQNALTGDGCGIGIFTTTALRDTLVIKGVRASSIILISSRGLSAGAIDSTNLSWSFYNETTPVDTVIFTRAKPTPSGGKFSWWVIKW